MESLFNAVSEVGWLVYLLCFVLVFLEAAGLPLPALTFALLAATLAGHGSLNFAAAVVATILGGTLGGPVGHWLGAQHGRPLLEKIGSKVKITPETLDSTQQQFEKRGNTVVLIRYFVPLLPWSAGIFAGIARMPMRRLVLFNFLGITAWALIQMTIVAFFSAQLKNILAEISFSTIFWLATGVVGTILLIRMFRKRSEARKAAVAG